MIESIIVVSSVGLFFGIALSIAAKVLHVDVDHRIEKVENMLPLANCGACGYAGCAAFAEAIVKNGVDPSGCTPGGSETAHEIADYLGVTANAESERKVAFVHCQGGIKEAKERAIYDGITDCIGASLVVNGSKKCADGCLGLSTCVNVCEFDALIINENGVAEVISDNCTACGACTTVCPRYLIDMVPESQKILLACNNHEKGAKVKKYCSVGCTACTLCVRAVTHTDAIEMDNNLPKMHYHTHENFVTSAHKCPSNCFSDQIRVRPKANINANCCGSNDCAKICPVKGAIIGEVGERHSIDKEKCIGCGLCIDVCPTKAITMWGSLGYTDKERRQGNSRDMT